MSFIKKIGLWLVRSSQNPVKYSLFVKSAGVALITLITVVAGVANIQLPSEDLTNLVDSVATFVQTAFLCISAATGTWGLLRKVYKTIVGSNAVLNNLHLFDK